MVIYMKWVCVFVCRSSSLESDAGALGGEGEIQ